MQSDFNPLTHVSDKARGEYVTRLSLRASDSQPRFGVYFAKGSHALLSMFHPSTQHWLVVNNLDPNTTVEIHLDTFYLRRTVKIKYEMQNSQFQRLMLAGADLESLEAAALADCQVLDYDAMTIRYPVHFDLQFLREQAIVPIDFGDLDGFVYGTMFCQPEDILVHVESFKVDVTKFLQAVRASVTRQIQRWGGSEYYATNQDSIIRMRISGDIYDANLADPYLRRTFITQPEERPRQERYAMIPPTANVNPFTDLQYPVPREVIRLIAINLSLQDILQNCLTSKQFNAAICEDDSFWREKLRTDYPQREATKSPNLSWKEFYQAVVGRDGLLGVRTGYSGLQLIGVLGFLSNIVVMLPNGRPFNFLAGRYEALVAGIPHLQEILPALHNISANAIWLRAVDRDLSKFIVKFGPREPEREHFKADEPDKYMPLTELGIELDRAIMMRLNYIQELVEKRLPQYPWVLNLTKKQVDDYLDALLISPGDDFTVQLRVLYDYKGDPVLWKDILDERTERGLIVSIRVNDEIPGNNPLYSEYNQYEKVYDDWSIGMIIELIRKKLRLTLNMHQ